MTKMAFAESANNIVSNAQWQDFWLSNEEKLWLMQNKVIRHGMVKGKRHLPFEFTNDEGIHQGLTSDYLQFIAERLGIRIETQFYGETIPEVDTALRENKIDFVTYLPKVSYRERVFSFSEPVIKMPVVLFGQKDSAIIQSLDAFEDETLIVQHNSYAHDFIIRNYPLIKTEYVNSTIEGLQKVSKEGGVFIHNVFSSEYNIRKHAINNLKIVGSAGFDYNLMFATSKQMSPFLSILEKAIIDLSEREKRLIFDKWINIQIEEKMDVALIVKIVASMVIFTLFVVGLFYSWNRQLTIKVAQRTKNLRDLARHIETVRENEKTRLAREIHDELGHTLTALTMSIRQIKNCKDETELNDKTKELALLVKSASQTSKQIMSDLRPSMLEDLGLIAALEWLTTEFTTRHKIPCDFKAEDTEIELSEEVAIALFRITQESLTNIAKHAHASEVKVSIYFLDSNVFLSISDDGLGLKAGWSTKEGSFGLQGMKERALSLQGSLKVCSSVEQGVELKIKLPI